MQVTTNSYVKVVYDVDGAHIRANKMLHIPPELGKLAFLQLYVAKLFGISFKIQSNACTCCRFCSPQKVDQTVLYVCQAWNEIWAKFDLGGGWLAGCLHSQKSVRFCCWWKPQEIGISWPVRGRPFCILYANVRWSGCVNNIIRAKLSSLPQTSVYNFSLAMSAAYARPAMRGCFLRHFIIVYFGVVLCLLTVNLGTQIRALLLSFYAAALF